MRNTTDRTTNYTIRPTSESSFAVEVFKTGLMRGRKHVLFFERYSGTLEYDRETPENSRVEITIDANSVVCRDQWLKPQKRRAVLAAAKNDMLDAEHFPRIGFSSERIQRKGSNRFEVSGQLTIRGMGKSATLEVAVVAVGSDRLDVDGTTRIKLSDYGLKPPSGRWLVGTRDEVLLRFLLWPERTLQIQ